MSTTASFYFSASIILICIMIGILFFEYLKLRKELAELEEGYYKLKIEIAKMQFELTSVKHKLNKCLTYEPNPKFSIESDKTEPK